MAKRFSIVTVNDEEIFLSGYVVPEELVDSNVFVEIMSEISNFTTVPVEINHCLVLDTPDKDVDISDEDLNILLDTFDALAEKGHIYSEELIEFEMNGLLEEEIIEEQ